MVKVKWHPKALDDLNFIFNYVRRDSPYYAKLIVQKIKTGVQKLKKFPQMGRKVPELNKNDIRELIIQNYRVIYQFHVDHLLILAIFHSKQQFHL